jgi:hypothetical protein
LDIQPAEYIDIDALDALSPSVDINPLDAISNVTGGGTVLSPGLEAVSPGIIQDLAAGISSGGISLDIPVPLINPADTGLLTDAPGQVGLDPNVPVQGP